MSDLKDSAHKQNMNQTWKQLDPMFQAQLRHYVLSKNKQKFNPLCQEFGFNEIQKGYVFDAIKIFTTQSQPATNNNNNNNNNRKRSRSQSDMEMDEMDELDQILDGCDDYTNANKKRRLNENETSESDNTYAIERIVEHKQIGTNGYEYKVKWVDYADDENSWEPSRNLETSAIETYWKKKGCKIDNNGNVSPIHTDKKLKSKSIRKKSKSITKKKKKKKKDKKNKKDKKKKKKVNKENDNDSDSENDEKEHRCIPCNKTFRSGKALGGHNATCKKKKKEKYWQDSDDENTNNKPEVVVIEDSD